MIIKAIRFTLPIAAALLATAANAGITYSGTVSPIRQFGTGTLVVNYSITTDGTLGTVFSTQFQSWSVDFVYNGNTQTINGSGDPLGYQFGNVVTTATELSMDFTRSSQKQFGLGIEDGSQIVFSGLGNEILGTGNNPDISVFYFDGSTFRYAGYVEPGPGFHVLGTAAAVPEPASWALLIAGFGLTGAAMRRRARVAAVA
jgi:hypothetical protein